MPPEGADKAALLQAWIAEAAEAIYLTQERPDEEA
jgi:hypothetical protein